MAELGSAEWQFDMYCKLGIRTAEYAAREAKKLIKDALKEALKYRKAISEAKDPYSAAQKVLGDNSKDALNTLYKIDSEGGLTPHDYLEMKRVINELSSFNDLNDASFNGAALKQINEHFKDRLELYKTDKNAFKNIMNEFNDIVNASKSARMELKADRNVSENIADAKIRVKAKDVARQMAKEMEKSAKSVAKNVVRDDFVRSLF